MNYLIFPVALVLFIKIWILQDSVSDVTMVGIIGVKWCYSGVKLSYSGVRVVLKGVLNGVLVVLSGVLVVLSGVRVV